MYPFATTPHEIFCAKVRKRPMTPQLLASALSWLTRSARAVLLLHLRRGRGGLRQAQDVERCADAEDRRLSSSGECDDGTTVPSSRILLDAGRARHCDADVSWLNKRDAARRRRQEAAGAQ
jgi:hypothetical protein